MRAITILNTPTLIDPAGNRDFINIFNNGGETLFLDYDGLHNTAPDIIFDFGITNGQVYNIIYWDVTSAPLPQIGAMLIANCVPANYVYALSIATTTYGGGTYTHAITVTQFTATTDIVGHLTFSTKLTVNNGWPVPPGTFFSISNDGNRNLFNKSVYGIVQNGPIDIRVQGA